jgi:cell division protein FtsI (penicillin-binding protein 3)
VNDARRNKRRVGIAVLVIFAVVAVFVVRLVDIQVVRASELNTESLSKRSVSQTTYGSRGNIVDSSGNVLADSVDRFDITASPLLVDEFERLEGDGETRTTISINDAIDELAATTGAPVADITKALTEKPDSNFAYVAKSVTLETLTAVRALKIPWIYDVLHPSRTYPNGAIAGNLVGFIGTDGPQAGLEYALNEKCVGSTNGTSTYERGADGIRIPGSTVTSKEAKDGGTLRLTIDRDFQWYVQQANAQRAVELGAKWATTVVVRVSDGHLMAVADYPSVDPNNVDGSAVDALGSRAFSTPYEPGSTMKSMTIASLLDAGQIEPLTQVVAPGRRELGNGESIKDAWAHADIPYTATGVLTNSSNTGISLLADKLAPEKRRDYMLAFGLNQSTGAFPGESSGYVPPTSDWDAVTNYAVQFGQGESTTSAQIASLYQTLGNGGVRQPLTLIEGCEWPDGTVTELPATEGTRAVSEAAADTTVRMMENVVTQGGLSQALTIPGYRLAAKTGTAEVANAPGGGYGNDYVVSIAGLVPAENPQYAIVVTIGEPSTMKTSTAVAPTFKKLVTQTIKTFRIEPSLDPSPEIPLTW